MQTGSRPKFELPDSLFAPAERHPSPGFGGPAPDRNERHGPVEFESYSILGHLQFRCR